MSTTLLTNDRAHCPVCKHHISVAIHPDQEVVPAPGDIAVCVFCGAVLSYKHDMTLRAMSRHHFAKLPTNVRMRLLHMQSEVRQRARPVVALFRIKVIE